VQNCGKLSSLKITYSTRLRDAHQSLEAPPTTRGSACDSVDQAVYEASLPL